MRLVTSELMRLIDREAIDHMGIPGPELMENAGRGIAERILSDILRPSEDQKVAVFCGKGNNGGDGYVVGRYLYRAGVDVTFHFLGPLDKLSEDARLNFDRAAGLGMELREIKSAADLPDRLECHFIIDAVFGTGFEGAPRGLPAELIDYINAQPRPVIAVDMPSGLSADNGTHEGAVVSADFTFTLALPKYGLFVSPGRELAGEVHVVPIGIPDQAVEKFDIRTGLITGEYVTSKLPHRKPDGHKGDFGKLLLVAGSTGLTGAAILAAKSALRSGCGLARVACPRTILPIIAGSVVEATGSPLPDVAKKGALALRGLGEIRRLIKEHDAVVIGPGLGQHHETFELVRRLVASLDKPAIIDADGLNAVARNPDIIKEADTPLILTPHPGEFRRLTGTWVPEYIHDRIETAREFAQRRNVVLILKGSPTIVADEAGMCYVNSTGNNGMATGGSGDVLAGITGTFLAQGMAAVDAALCGVYVHALAGDIAADYMTSRTMIAGDMIDYLGEVFQEVE